jgi:hypothetical protein
MIFFQVWEGRSQQTRVGKCLVTDQWGLQKEGSLERSQWDR